MLPQFQEPSLGWILRIEEPFEEPFTVNCPRFKKFSFRINKLQKALLQYKIKIVEGFTTLHPLLVNNSEVNLMLTILI